MNVNICTQAFVMTHLDNVFRCEYEADDEQKRENRSGNADESVFRDAGVRESMKDGHWWDLLRGRFDEGSINIILDGQETHVAVGRSRWIILRISGGLHEAHEVQLISQPSVHRRVVRQSDRVLEFLRQTCRRVL